MKFLKISLHSFAYQFTVLNLSQNLDDTVTGSSLAIHAKIHDPPSCMYLCRNPFVSSERLVFLAEILHNRRKEYLQLYTLKNDKKYR